MVDDDTDAQAEYDLTPELRELLTQSAVSPTVHSERARSALRAEVEVLAADEQDRAEAAQVLRDMESLQGGVGKTVHRDRIVDTVHADESEGRP